MLFSGISRTLIKGRNGSLTFSAEEQSAYSTAPAHKAEIQIAFRYISIKKIYNDMFCSLKTLGTL